MKSSPDDKKDLYSKKDLVTVLLGIPIVASVAVFCVNFVTSYAGI